MIKFILPPLCLLIGLNNIFAQNRVFPKFKESDPLWMNTVVNRNYEFDPTSSADSLGSHSFIQMKEVGDYIYSLFRTSDPEPNRPPNGYIINKTNKLTGEVIWTDVNTVFNGSPGSLYAQHIFIRDDNNVEIIADRKINFINENTRYYPFSYRRVYNHLTGEVLSTDYDKNNKAILGANNTFKYARYHKVLDDSIYLAHYNGTLSINDTVFQTLRVGLLNGAMDEARDTVAILYDSDVPLGFDFHFTNDNYSWTLNDSTIAWLSTHFAHDLSVNTNKARLFLVDIRDIKNIFVRKKIILDDILFLQEIPRTYTNLTVKDDQIFITNGNYIFSDNKLEYNILHLDNEGEVIRYYKDIKRDGLHYTYTIPVKITDSLTYFIGTKPILTQHDLFTLDKAGKYNLVTTISTKDDKPGEYFKILENSCLLTDNNIFIYGGAYDEVNPIKFTILIHGFELNSLIKGFNVHAHDFDTQDGTIGLYPNPTKGIVNIPRSISVDKISIYGLNGLEINNIMISNNQFNAESLPNGIYIIKLWNDNKFLTYKLVKVE
jgi:hypothetical protein